MATYYAVLELKDVDSQREADHWAEAISDAAQAPIVTVTQEWHKVIHVPLRSLRDTPTCNQCGEPAKLSDPPPLVYCGRCGEVTHQSRDQVRATVALSVTLKIEATGQTPDKLIDNATLSALEVVEDAITHRHGHANDLGWHSLADVIEHTGIIPDPCHLSIEGATALVNTQEIEALFEENE